MQGCWSCALMRRTDRGQRCRARRQVSSIEDTGCSLTADQNPWCGVYKYPSAMKPRTIGRRHIAGGKRAWYIRRGSGGSSQLVPGCWRQHMYIRPEILWMWFMLFRTPEFKIGLENDIMCGLIYVNMCCPPVQISVISGVIGSDVPWLECPACNALTWVITVME